MPAFDVVFTSTTAEYLSQKLRISLTFFLEEWYLDKNEGLPFYQSIFKKNPDINLIADVYKDKILSVPEVQSIITFDITIDSPTRRLSIDFTVLSIDGETVEVSV